MYAALKKYFDPIESMAGFLHKNLILNFLCTQTMPVFIGFPKTLMEQF